MGLGSDRKDSKEGKRPHIVRVTSTQTQPVCELTWQGGLGDELVKTTVKDPHSFPQPCVCMLVSAWLCFIEFGEPNVWWLCQAIVARCRGQ